MTHDTHAACANCGRALTTPLDVCPCCDSALMPEPPRGRHHCPRCAQRFEQPLWVGWPPAARWYWPQKMKPQCPHCHTFLRDRNQVPMGKYDGLMWGAPVVAMYVFHAPPAIVAITLLVPLAVFWRRWRQARALAHGEAQRYGMDEAQP